MIPTIEKIVEGLLSGAYTADQATAWLKIHAAKEPEWWYNEDGHAEPDWEALAEYAYLLPGEYIEVTGAMEVCTKYVACIEKTVDAKGDPDEVDYQLFDTKEEAIIAAAGKP